jgi:hypothetical protein
MIKAAPVSLHATSIPTFEPAYKRNVVLFTDF